MNKARVKTTSNEARQKDEEKSYLDRFKKLFPEFPQGQVSLGKPPAPDFLIERLSTSDFLGIYETLNVRRAARSLANFVAKFNLLGENQPVEFTANNGAKEFPSEIESIFVNHLPELPSPQGAKQISGQVPDLIPQSLQERIDEKNKSCAGYRQSVSELWLLIVADGYGLASKFRSTDAAIKHRYESCFDRVFLLQYFELQVVELNIDRV